MIELQANCQTLKTCCHDMLVSDSLNAISMRFAFSDEWDGLLKTAQFTQRNGEGAFVTYNVLLDEDEVAMLPNEITDGVVLVSVFGTGGVERLTTNAVAFPIVKSGFVGDGQTPIPPTPDLYQQLVMKVLNTAGSPVIGDNGNWYLDNMDTGVKADWSAEQENAAASAAAAAKSATEAAESAKAAGELAITENVEGSCVVVSDASAKPLHGLRIFGRTTQGGTPTPTAPVELVGMAGPTVTICGRNVFDVGNYHEVAVFIDPANNARYTTYPVGRTIAIQISPNTTYTVKKATSTVMRIATSKGYPVADGKITTIAYHSAASDAPLTITSGNDDRWMALQLFVNSDADGKYGSIAANIGSLMVEVGTTAHPWEAYTGNWLQVAYALHGIPVSGGGHYTDANGQKWHCDQIDYASGLITRNTGLVTFDGTEGWETETGAFTCGVPNATAESAICNRYIWANNTAHTTAGNFDTTGGKRVRFHNGGMTLADWKAQLAAWAAEGQPLTVLYIADATERLLSESDIDGYKALHTFAYTSTICNNAGAWMAVDYAADVKRYIDKKIATVATAAVNG